MKKLRKFSVVLLFTVIITTAGSLFSGAASAYEFEPEGVTLHSEAVYMQSLDTGEVIVSKNADQKRVPASLTKIMTCIIVLDKFQDNPAGLKTEKISAGEEAFTELEGTGYSNAGIEAGESLSYYDLLCALMIPSACEAANILAINVGGSIENFVTMMNDKAKELGMNDTTYYNAHGLSLDGQESNITTCYDLAILCRYALNNYPVFTEITSKYSYTMENETTLTSTNKLLDSSSDYYYGYVYGIKTGYLDEAGRCLASVAEKNGYTYLIITMGAPGYDDDGYEAYYNCEDHKNLYMWAYANLSYQTFLEENEEVTDAEVQYAKGDGYVNLKPVSEVSAIWSNDIDISEVEERITVSENIVAPIYAGDVLGSVEFVYDGQVIAQSDLVAVSDVKKATARAEMTVAANFFLSSYFRMAVIIIAIIILIYTILFFVYVQRRSRRRVKAIKEKYQALNEEEEEK